MDELQDDGSKEYAWRMMERYWSQEQIEEDEGEDDHPGPLYWKRTRAMRHSFDRYFRWSLEFRRRGGRFPH